MSSLEHARPTGADVARVAGTAQSSVSLVFSGKADGRISPALEARIRAAAEQLGYEPIETGRALRSGTVNALGLVVTDFENSFFGPVSHGAQEAAARYNHSVLLMEAGAPEDGFLPGRALDRGIVDGLLLFAVEPPEPTAQLRARVVLVESVHPAYSSVVFDSADGMRQAIDHLVGLGHFRIGYAGVHNGRWTFVKRRQAWEAAMRDRGLATLERDVSETAITWPAAAEGALALLSQPAPPTAVICADDLVAAGVYRAAVELGLAIPQDLSVISFGGTVVGDVLAPSLTTIHASGRLLGAAAVDLRLSGLVGPVARTMPVRLRTGGSTARPRLAG